MKLVQKFITLLFLTNVSINTEFKIIQYEDNQYLANAPKEIVDHVESIAGLVGFDKNLEIAIPKKSAMHINPWNKVIANGTNSVTKNAFIIINQEFYANLAKEEQVAMIAAALENIKTPNHTARTVTIVSALMSILLLIAIYLTLKKTILINHKHWVILFVSFAAMILIKSVCFTKAETIVRKHFDTKFLVKIHAEVIKKTQNREAMIKSLETLDRFIKKELEDGETFFKPDENTFSDLANRLRA